MSGRWPEHARKWTLDEIVRDARIAQSNFRERRYGEPLARYLAAFDKLETANTALIEQLEKVLSIPVDAQRIAALLKDEHLGTALRYLGAPPVSKDDLKILSESTLAPSRVAADPVQAEAIQEVICNILDPKRFPWIKEARLATNQERKAAILASSVLAACQRVQTVRRGDEKAVVENGAIGVLVGLGWSKSARSVKVVRKLRHDAPALKEFMVQTNLGDDNADVIVALDDGRLLAIECKGSNSGVNSRKRLNKEAAKNARAWIEVFGDQVVPAAAIQGVFKPEYVEGAQETPMVIFWGHRLADLRDFMLAAKR